MAIWLFRRKSRRKRRSDSSDLSMPANANMANMQDVASITASATGPHFSSSPIRRRSDRSQRDRVLSNAPRQPNKLQRRNRTYSFESGRADNLEMALNGYKGTKTSAPTLHSQSRRRTDREREAEIKAMSGLDKSKSKRRNDFDPLRPAVEPYSVSASQRHGSFARAASQKQHPDSFAARKARGEKRFMSIRSKHKGKNHSDISLPSAESIDSAMSSDSEQVAFVISPLATLAPKPTLRYASHPVRGANGAMYGPPVPYRELSHRLPRRLAMPIPEATLRAHKRVDDLANDMNASDLRELMERDMRRRERKRVSDQDRAARRLSRQAERQQRMQQLEQQQQQQTQQQDQEMRDARSSPDMARGVLGREAAEIPQDTTSAVVTSATRRDCTPPPPLNQRSYLPSPPPEEHEDVEMARHSESNASARSSRRRSPVEMFYRPDSSPVESVENIALPDVQESASDHAAQEFAVANANVPARTNSALRKLAKLRKRLSNLSNSSTKSPAVSKTSKSSATGSVRGHTRGGVSWTSLGGILRWASRSKRSRSNSVRNVSGSSGVITGTNSVTEKTEKEMSPEELLAATAAATEAALSGPKNLTLPARAPLNPGAKPVMQRTTSRFREDLPEFLLSPSTSRVHSPVLEMEHENEGESMSEIMDVEPLPIQGAVTTFMHDESDRESGHESDEESIIMPPTAFHGHYHSVQPPDESWLNVDADVGAGPHHLNRDDEQNEEDDVVADSLDPSPEPQQSLSLASIDSEGSWLSGGRAMRRRSAQPQRSLDNVSRNSYQRWTSNDHINNHSNYYGESLSALASSDVEPDHEVDDDNETVNGEADTSGLTKTDANELAHENENESATWGSVNERKVQVDSLHTASLMKSHEGLLKTFYDGEEAEASPTSPLSPASLDSENSPVSDDFDSVQRATSVNLGRGHVRHISAGSAKLLEM